MIAGNKMNMFKKTLLLQLFLYLATTHFLIAQKGPDTLSNKSYEYLNNKITQYENDSLNLWVYLNASLAKSKQENNSKRVIEAYENMACLSHGKFGLRYTDSLVLFGKKKHNDKYLASAYIIKGTLYYSWKQYKKALDNYLIANTIAEKTKDDFLKFRTKYSIASIKFYLGFYDEAAALQKECCAYFKNEDPVGYTNALHALGLSYNKMGKYELCTATNNIGLKASEKTDLTDRAYFIHSEGLNQYSKGNYKKSIQMITESMPAIIKNGDFANETIGNFYIGKSYLALNNKELALNYFRKVDRSFVEKNYIRPDLRENYEILINHYKKEGDRKLQLHYIEKLLKADSILSVNFKYLSGKVHKEYDSRKLEQTKNRLLKELDERESTTYILYITITLFFFLTLFLLYRYYINQRTYRQKFEELMQQNTQTTDEQKSYTTETEKEENKKPDINPEVVSTILKQLEKFETNKKFLQKELTLVNLAANFGTNTNYLSKVISHYREKNYINYLNDLRVDYIVEILKTDAKMRNYTIKALAEEAGFSTAQHFSKAFYARTGIYPSYFVTELSREYIE
jgi:AraC-like DNA-binding protein